jgi:glycine/D-amino acid oxidase-like deaminating enzyme
MPLAREYGLRVDRLERSEAERRYPQISFDGVETLYFEHEAGYLKARQACQTVCDEFVREGGTFLQRAVKPGAIRSESLIEPKLEGGGTLQADQYVFACGPWLGGMFPEVIGNAIHPTRQEIYYFGAPAGDGRFGPDKFPGWIDFDERLFYGFPNVDQRGVKIADDTRGEDFDPTSGDRSPTPEGIERARKFLGRRFPALKSAPLLEARVCQYENSPDGHLIVDRHPAARNAWIVGGGSGHGFKQSPALGEHVAQCVLDEAKPDPMVSISRLARLNRTTTQFDRKK